MSSGVSGVPDTTEPHWTETAYIEGSRAIYGTDYMRGEKDRAGRLARRVIDASGLVAEVCRLRAERDKLQAENTEWQEAFVRRVNEQCATYRDEWEESEAECDRLRSTIEAAQRLHRQNTGRINVCVHCQGTWPCATTRALAAAVVGEPEALAAPKSTPERTARMAELSQRVEPQTWHRGEGEPSNG